MKLLIPVVSIAVVLAAIAAGGAGANGSPYSPGLIDGWDGVLGEESGLRYVTLGTGGSTIVAAVRTNGGRVVRTRHLRGYFGIPLVAYDGTSGGLSGDGKRLVVGSYGPPPGISGTTRFAVLDTKTFKLRRLATLHGSWSFDAISPDGSTLYLTHHLRAGEHPLYRVRTYDVRRNLVRGALVDRLEGEGDMGGEPVTRASSSDGRWAYTLYARRGHEPFVHALDTEERAAYCIDLPLELGYEAQYGLRLKLRERSDLLSVRSQSRALATVNTESWEVEREAS